MRAHVIFLQASFAFVVSIVKPFARTAVSGYRCLSSVHGFTHPLFVDPASGLNDDLNGVERPVAFDILQTGSMAQVVHSLAKWKRMALYKYGFSAGEGLYTDMNAIRRDEEMDNLHSIYVDQWDWEKVVAKEERTLSYLKQTVQSIVNAICDTLETIKQLYPQISLTLSRQVSFVTTQQLEDLYPNSTPKERENLYLKETPHRIC